MDRKYENKKLINIWSTDVYTHAQFLKSSQVLSVCQPKKYDFTPQSTDQLHSLRFAKKLARRPRVLIKGVTFLGNSTPPSTNNYMFLVPIK